MSRRDNRQTRRAGSFVPSTPVPKTLPSLLLWLRSDLGITLDGSNNVSTWADQSGVGDSNRNATNGTAANRPPYTASNASYNNLPTLGFNTLFLQLATGSWSTALVQPFTIYFVGNGSGAGNYVYVADNAAGSLEIYDAAGASLNATDNALSNQITTSHGTTSPSAVYVTMTGGNGTAAVNARTAQASGTVGSASTAGITIGNFPGGGGQLVGPMAEVIIYGVAHGATQINTIMTYLGARYNITIGA